MVTVRGAALGQASRCCFAGASNWASWRRSSSACASVGRSRRLARDGGFGGFGSGVRGTSQPMRWHATMTRACGQV